MKKFMFEVILNLEKCINLKNVSESEEIYCTKCSFIKLRAADKNHNYKNIRILAVLVKINIMRLDGKVAIRPSSHVLHFYLFWCTITHTLSFIHGIVFYFYPVYVYLYSLV